MSFTDILFTIGDWVVFLNVIIAVVYVVGVRANSGSALSLIVLAIMNCFMQLMGYKLQEYFTSEFALVVRHMWYVSFMVVDAFAIYIIFSLHQRFKLIPSAFTKLIALSFLTMICIQGLRYFSYVLLDLDVAILGFLYKNGVVAVNVSVVFSSLFMVIKDFLLKEKERVV